MSTPKNEPEKSPAQTRSIVASYLFKILKEDPGRLETIKAEIKKLQDEADTAAEKTHFGYFLKFIEFYDGTEKRAIYEIPKEYRDFLLNEFNMTA